VSDLRQNPKGRDCCPVAYNNDPEQLTQILYNDVVDEKARNGEWSFVEVLDQPNLYDETWTGYTGWILSSHIKYIFTFYNYTHSVISEHATIFKRVCYNQGCLPEEVEVRVSFGTWLSVDEVKYGWAKVILPSRQYGYIRSSDIAAFVPKTDEKVIRDFVAQRALRLLGYLYSWGGRSAFDLDIFETGKQFLGVDCSGLVSLLYKSCGIIVPRDSSKQALWVNNVSIDTMQVGDVFFYGIANSSNPVSHVMALFAISPEPEIVQSGYNSTRIYTVLENFGKPFTNLIWGEQLASGDYLTWGSFFPIREWHWANFLLKSLSGIEIEN